VRTIRIQCAGSLFRASNLAVKGEAEGGGTEKRAAEYLGATPSARR
jgi:hypothetical protein